MKTHRLFAILLALALLCATAATAEGILPVLQTPPPEIIETISYHRAMNYSSTPSASTTSDGGYAYNYSSVTYPNYLDFGRALAQEGFTLADSSLTDIGVTHCVVTNGAELTVEYNPFLHELTVIYPPRVMALDIDEENPYVIDEAVEPVLPEIKQTISMHAVTGLRFGTPERVEEGYRYNYSGVTYECYSQFGVKLGEEGFSLVSSETTEEGLNRAVVSDGTVELVLDYNQESKYAYVTYPFDASPRDAILFDDYTPLQKGQTIDLRENLSLTVTGWQAVDYYCDYYYSENWIPSKYYGTDHYTGDGVQQMLVSFEIDDRCPETLRVLYMLDHLTVYVDGQPIDMNYGRYTESSGIYQDSDSTANVNEVFTFGVGFQLTEAQAAHPENIVITFSDLNNAVPYAYRLEP